MNDSVYSHLSRNNLLYGLYYCSLVFEKRKFNWNCTKLIRLIYSVQPVALWYCNNNVAGHMWLQQDMTFFLLNWRHIKSMILTCNCLENLANWKQYVRINGTNSTILNVTHWVLQGSILGPLLFLTFINHLPSAIVDIFTDNYTFSSSVNFFLGTLTLQSPFKRTLTVHTKSYWKLKSSRNLARRYWSSTRKNGKTEAIKNQPSRKGTKYLC